MLLTIAAGAAIALAIPQDTDTTFAVAPGTRLDLRNYAGDIVITTWGRNEMRIVADHGRRDALWVEQADGVVHVRPASWKGGDFDLDIASDDVSLSWSFERNRPSIVDFEITVPENMALDVATPFADVTIDGPVGGTTIALNEGDATVRRVRGPLTVRCVEGDVTVEDVTGRIRINAIDGDVSLETASGDVSVETTDGEIRLAGITSSSVVATSVDGDILFAGGITPQGLYSFATHDGDVTLWLPPNAGARVSVATYDGDVTSDFPIALPEDFQGHRARFTLGTGDAQIEIEAFDGDIEILYMED
jgi:hypothetical protein